MADLDAIEVHSRTITALFETQEAAKKAVSDLENAGIPARHINLVEGGDRTTTATTDTSQDSGFWASLKELFLPDEDRYAYAEGLRRGGYLVSVQADEANYDRVLDILDADGSVDMDQRESQWRREGWAGYQTSAAPAAAVGLASAATTTQTTTQRAATASDRTAAVGTTTGQALEAGRDEVIPVYEENLRVGKRDVNHGRVRIRSYVVETPVSEQVSLRSEDVRVERRPVDRAVTGADALFTDRVIEVEEHAEEAVIAKDVRVKEEIGIRKTATERVETVADKVRRTEVEIDDARTAGRVAAFSAERDANRIVEHMDVLASDGTKIGTVDHLDGPDRIKLAKSTSPDGQHHYVPLAWVDHVDTHVHLTKAAADVKAGW